MPRARPKIHHPVRASHRVFIVFHHDDRIAHIPQSAQRVEQSAVVAVMQANRRLVQHVRHPDQAGADLTRQANALCLAPGQGRRRAIQREIIQPHVQQKSQPPDNFLQCVLGDPRLHFGQFERNKKSVRLGDRHRRDLGQVLALDLHAQGFGL